MKFTSKNIHHKMQAHYGVKAVKAAYEEYEAEVLAKYKNQEVIIAGIFPYILWSVLHCCCSSITSPPIHGPGEIMLIQYDYQ